MTFKKKKKVLILYTSKSGNTESFVDWFEDTFSSQLDIDSENLYRNKKLINFEQYDKIILGTYTWNDGKIPVEMKKVLIEKREVLQERTEFLFGSGITIYPFFCGALDGAQIILGQNYPLFKFELTFIPSEHLKEIEQIKEIIKNDFIK